MNASDRALRRAALAALVLFSSACAGVHAGGALGSAEGEDLSDVSGAAASPTSVVLAVNNRGFADVLVYVLDGGVPTRLGRVAALERTEILVRRGSSLAAPVRLLLRTAGSNIEYAPEPIWARSGELIQLTIQPLLTTSEMTVR